MRAALITEIFFPFILVFQIPRSTIRYEQTIRNETVYTIQIAE